MMPDLGIFLLGCLVSFFTLAAVVGVGISEGKDAKLSGRHVDANDGVDPDVGAPSGRSVLDRAGS